MDTFGLFSINSTNRYKERSEIEALFFATNTQLATLRQPSFIPPEGVSLYALQKAWDALEKAEHRREVALRNELLRLERLEQLAYKFERKVRKPNDKPNQKNTKKYVCFFFSAPSRIIISMSLSRDY